jgi:predicted component of type VI protein secretion system
MSNPSQGSPARYRLRFLLQEFDLAPGHTLLGRGDDCHITIFDPAISRRHARIFVDEQHAILEDLGSRNGCRVNGVPIKGEINLSDGDRIRLGTQELVLSEVKAATSQAIHRQTGSLCFCGSCRAAYAKEMDSCPHCGSTTRGPNPLAHSDTDPEDDTENLPQDRRYASGPP